MKKIAIIVLVLLGIGVIAYFLVNKPVPEGRQGSEADAMAHKMLEAIGMSVWEKIPYVAWTFQGSRHYVWDKRHHLASISWDDYTVKLDTKTQQGVVSLSGKMLDGKEKQDAIDKAWGYWCNDSFWLNAPSKVYDPGTELSVTDLDEGGKGLKVTYSSGGVTPGDTYVWALDADGLPRYFKMWVSIIPVGGVKATWEQWEDFDGAKLSTLHQIGPKAVTLTNLKTGNTLEEMELQPDYFSSLQ